MRLIEKVPQVQGSVADVLKPVLNVAGKGHGSVILKMSNRGETRLHTPWQKGATLALISQGPRVR